MDYTGETNSKTIYATLKEEMLNLTIKPGQQISENEICARFGVSRTPVRTAFQRLKDAGLITSVPYKSTCASLLNFEQIEQSIYMRVAVESMILRDLIETIDPFAIEKIRYNLRRQEVLLAGEFTADQFYEIDSALHGIWFKFSHKESLWRLIQRMQVNYTRFRMLDIVAVHNFHEIYEEHLVLFEIICNKRPEQIEEMMRRHLNGGILRLGNRIRTEFADYFVQLSDKTDTE